MEVGGSGAQGHMLLLLKSETWVQDLSQSPKARQKRMDPPSLDGNLSEWFEIQRKMNNLEEGREGRRGESTQELISCQASTFPPHAAVLFLVAMKRKISFEM